MKTKKKKLKNDKQAGYCPSCNKLSLFVRNKRKRLSPEEKDKYDCVTCGLTFFFSP